MAGNGSALMYVNEDKSHAVLFALGLDKAGDNDVSLRLGGLTEGARYEISEIDCDEPHGAELNGREMRFRLRGPYDSAVFELTRPPSA